jgi:hypothetical protein
MMTSLSSYLHWLKFLIGEKVAIVSLLLLIAATFFWGSVWQLQHDVADQQATLLQLKQSAQKNNFQAEAHTKQPELLSFYTQFPQEGQITFILEKIHALATHAKVNLLQGEYQLKRDSNPRLLQYTLTFPTQAHYPELKKFIQQAEFAFPTLLLKKMVLKREDVMTDQANVELQFHLLVTPNGVALP